MIECIEKRFVSQSERSISCRRIKVERKSRHDLDAACHNYVCFLRHDLLACRYHCLKRACTLSVDYIRRDLFRYSCHQSGTSRNVRSITVNISHYYFVKFSKLYVRSLCRFHDGGCAQILCLDCFEASKICAYCSSCCTCYYTCFHFIRPPEIFCIRQTSDLPYTLWNIILPVQVRTVLPAVYK